MISFKEKCKMIWSFDKYRKYTDLDGVPSLPGVVANPEQVVVDATIVLIREPSDNCCTTTMEVNVGELTTRFIVNGIWGNVGDKMQFYAWKYIKGKSSYRTWCKIFIPSSPTYGVQKVQTIEI